MRLLITIIIIILNKVHQKVIVIKKNMIWFWDELWSGYTVLWRGGWFCTWLCSEGGLKRVEELQVGLRCERDCVRGVWTQTSQLSRAGISGPCDPLKRTQTSARTGAWTYRPSGIPWSDGTKLDIIVAGAGQHRPPFQLSCSAGDRLHL